MSLSEIQSITKSGKMVFVEFGAEWCGPCKKLKPLFWAEAKKRSKCAFVAVDVDDDEETATHYKVKAVPQVIAFKNGKELGRMEGFKSKEAFLEFVEGMDKK